MTGTAIFLDTTIQIARLVHSPLMKRRIEECTRQYDVKVTSSVVRQEFKRRLLKEAKYLLDQLNRRKSYAEVCHHVLRLPDFPKNKRKRNICLPTLFQLFPARMMPNRQSEQDCICITCSLSGLISSIPASIK